MSGWGPSNATPGSGWGTSIDPPRVSPWETPVGAKPSSAGQDSSDWSQKAQEMVNSMGKDTQTHSNGSQSRGYQSFDTPPSREASQQRDPHRSREFSRPRDDPPQERGYSSPPPDDEPVVSIEEVWPGFVEADQSRDFDDVKPALARLCEAFTGKCWTDLEKKLRDEGCNTYLVATEDPVSFGYTLVNLKREPNQKFRVIPSFIKPGTVKSGRMALGVASSYEENLIRLNDAGVVRPSGIPRCHNCKQEGHITSTCPEEKREVERSRNFGKCYNCGAEDHRTRTCDANKLATWLEIALKNQSRPAAVAARKDIWFATALSRERI
ncbi:hypothetical protein BGX34_000681 [Mortierella sp. NVP85]|nr:hypothetical protein BGX34_000681 [Mortierella sp. NVP85]